MELSSDPTQLLHQGTGIKGLKTRHFNVFKRALESFEKDGPTEASWKIIQETRDKYEEHAENYSVWCSAVADICAAEDIAVEDKERRLAAIAMEQTIFETQNGEVSKCYLRCAQLWEDTCKDQPSRTAPTAACKISGGPQAVIGGQCGADT